jgi:hypothetical protein
MKLISKIAPTIVLLLLTVPAAVGQILKINEFMPFNSTFADTDGDFSGWLELFNSSSNDVLLSDYQLVINDDSTLLFQLPASLLAPKKFFLIWFSAKSVNITENEVHAPFSLPAEIANVKIVGPDNSVFDQLSMDAILPKVDESIVRLPDGSSSLALIDPSQCTPNSSNKELAPWKKLSSGTLFSPRDSSPNASLVHDGYMWVMGGYRYADRKYFSRSDVWRSADGVHWELVNDHPPYDPYSVFVSFKGKIWAFHDVSFSSVDGVTWDTVKTNVTFPQGHRGTLFNDQIWLQRHKTIWKSSDGVSWELVTASAPWQARAIPAFLAFKGKLWMYGGGIGYGTLSQYYFRDVWSSENGKDWVLETPQADWDGRYWFTYQAFDDRLWVMGGWSFFEITNGNYGNKNDVWTSTDGKVWEQVQLDYKWAPRHASLSWVKDNAIWFSSGYGGGGYLNLYNDIWKFSKLRQSVGFTAENVTYGDFVSTGNFVTTLASEVSAFSNTIKHDDQVEFIAAGSAEVKVYNTGSIIYQPLDSVLSINVRKANLEVRGPDLKVEFGEQFFPAVDRDGFAYSGFLRNDTYESIGVMPRINEYPLAALAPGLYPLEISGGEANNYQLSLQPGTVEVKSSSGFFVFPNPATTQITVVQGAQDPPYNIAIFNSEGRLVKKINAVDNNPITFDVSALPRGLYIYQMSMSQVVKTGKFVLN